MASVYFLLFCDILLPGIFGVTEWGFKRYIKYEPGDMNLIITAPHGGRLNPSIQSNGHNWPYRANGCKGSDGKCIWKHNCGLTSTKCIALIKNDVCTLKIARDIADEIKAITGEWICHEIRENTGGLYSQIKMAGVIVVYLLEVCFTCFS